MADLQGWKYNSEQDTKAVILSEDVTEGNVLSTSDGSTSPMTVAIGGAGGVPFGIALQTVDISEDGTRSTVVSNGLVPLTAAAAITDADIPVKQAASGQVTPCDTNNDVVVGKPQHTASSGSIVLVDLKNMGSYYGV